jgi:hypothetical protein
MQPGLEGRQHQPSAFTVPQLCGGFTVTPRRQCGSSMMITAFAAEGAGDPSEPILPPQLLDLTTIPYHSFPPENPSSKPQHH